MVDHMGKTRKAAQISSLRKNFSSKLLATGKQKPGKVTAVEKGRTEAWKLFNA